MARRDRRHPGGQATGVDRRPEPDQSASSLSERTSGNGDTSRSGLRVLELSIYSRREVWQGAADSGLPVSQAPFVCMEMEDGIRTSRRRKARIASLRSAAWSGRGREADFGPFGVLAAGARDQRTGDGATCDLIDGLFLVPRRCVVRVLLAPTTAFSAPQLAWAAVEPISQDSSGRKARKSRPCATFTNRAWRPD